MTCLGVQGAGSFEPVNPGRYSMAHGPGVDLWGDGTSRVLKVPIVDQGRSRSLRGFSDHHILMVMLNANILCLLGQRIFTGSPGGHCFLSDDPCILSMDPLNSRMGMGC